MRNALFVNRAGELSYFSHHHLFPFPSGLGRFVTDIQNSIVFQFHIYFIYFDGTKILMKTKHRNMLPIILYHGESNQFNSKSNQLQLISLSLSLTHSHPSTPCICPTQNPINTQEAISHFIKQKPLISSSHFLHTKMANSTSLFFIITLVAFAPLCFSHNTNGGYLYPQFYDRTCPQAQEIVKSIVAKAVAKEPRMAASLLRLHFHDCFVKVYI